MKTSSSFLALLTSLSALTSPAAAATNKTGWAGTLSTLDGGLSGTVTVTSPNQLLITNYELEDASAPALYWWGSATPDLVGGFRISNKQVKDASGSSTTYTVDLDAGKTTDDFVTVGLWCERFSANFGQATLAAVTTGGGGGGGGGSGSAASGGSATATTTAGGGGMKSGAAMVAAKAVGWTVVGAGAGVVAVLLL